jgi:hypothetical protein
MPQTGRLQVDTYALDIGKPIENAVVQVMSQGARNLPGEKNIIIEQMVTNSSGQSNIIELPAPPVDFSLTPPEISPDGLVIPIDKPYSEYDVSVLLDGYEQVHIEGVQILPDTISYQDVILNPLTGHKKEWPTTITIDKHTLWGNFPPQIPQAEVKPLPDAGGHVILPEPVVPEFIIVHMGMPQNTAAAQHWVPFKDYIKNVACNEIFATWPVETLHANILAIISITLNRVFTEWYRGQGFNFTITNTTQLDQKYVYGRNIFVEISQVVDEIFTTYITRPGIRQPLFAQYNDGIRANYPGRMSQWGSKYLGEKGYSALDILKYYFGQDIYLDQAEKVEGVPISYSGYPLYLGAYGPNVRWVQERLNRISDNFPAIPKLRVDGFFGPETQASVKKFQEVFRLTQDGIVGFSTWYRLSHLYVAVTRMAELQ